MSEFESTQEHSIPLNSIENESFVVTDKQELTHDKCIVVPTGLKNVKDCAKWLGILDGALATPVLKDLPKVKPVAEKEHFLDSVLRKERSSSHTKWCSERPFHSKVVAAKWLTKTNPTEDSYTAWTEDKQVIHLELSLEGSGIAYVPGDSMGICCPNPEYLVQIVLNVLKRSHSSRTISLDSPVSCVGFNGKHTLGELLRFGLDLIGSPKKVAVTTLAQYCQDPEEAILMQNLTSKSTVGKQLWSTFVEAQNIGLGDLLYLFPSCTPTLSALLQCACALPPRYYSIASSPLRDASKVSLAFSMVRSVCKLPSKSVEDGSEPPEVRRQGVCTHYLLNLLKPWLLHTEDSPASVVSPSDDDVVVRLFHKSSISFQLPGSVNHPLILIGPGTGVAPFVGFLDHRALLEYDRTSNSGGEDISTGLWRGGFDINEDDLPCECNSVESFIHSVEPGPVHLFFGCRTDHDYLYRTTLEKHLQTGTLTSLDVAQSRVTEQKVYVTHKIEQRGLELARLILSGGAYIYVCGDGNQMAKDVYAAFKSVLMKHSCHTTEEAAEGVLADLKHRRRYVLDIWS